jgi:uncharacterized protein YbjT (DUF2867 family)
MTRTRVPPVLVNGATGRVGRAVVDLLIDAGVPVRALTHRSEAAATLPANVEVVTGDLTVPESLDAGLRGVSPVFLLDRRADECSGSCRASRNLRAACRLSLIRADAEAALRLRFDIRAFHDALLGHGALPLATLREAVTRDLGLTA